MSMQLNLKSLRPFSKKIRKLIAGHGIFIVTMVVLLTYLLVVWRISSYVSAEPDGASESAAAAAIPRIDKNAIEQIQALEDNNTQVRSLFNSARNNPFQE